jgi:hypothetical protein
VTTLRSLLIVTTVLAGIACGDGRRASGAPPSGIGPDAILVRVPSDGGLVRAHRVGSDSVLWQSRDRAPAVGTVLGFDEFLGLVMVQDRQGAVSAVNLRLGTVESLGDETLRGDLVAEGAAAFGFNRQGRIVRLTASGPWSWDAPGGATTLIPNPDGSLLVLTGLASATTIRRVIPPETTVTDSTSIPAVRASARTLAGDRVWFVTDSGLLALGARDLNVALRLPLRDSIVAMVPTPSGDRVFLATGEARLRIVDRYAERERGRVELPAAVRALRMDPDGHYLLAEVAGHDSTYVISIGTARVVNTLATTWRRDLPIVTPDGRVLLAQGRDAVLVDAESGRERMRYAGGASDQWELVRWNGLRPRAAGLDRPVEFEEFAADSAAADSALTAMIAARYGDLGSIARAPAGAPTSPPDDRAEQDRREAIGARGTWTVSFATMLVQERAQSMADSIVVDGRHARVVPGNRDGVPVYRVLLGPFDTRQAAERAGMTSRLSYWVFEGAP